MTEILSARDFLDTLMGAVNPSAADQRPASYDRPVRLGTVEPYWTAGLPKVLFDGEALIGSKGYAWDGKGGYVPSAGERVFLIPVGQSFVIGGPISAGLPFLRQIALPFLAGTFAYPGFESPGFTRSSAGIVVVKGMMSTPAGGVPGGTLLGTLPVGFRPDSIQVFGVDTDSTANAIAVGADGTMRLQNAVAGNVWISMAGIRFPAAGVATWQPVGAFGGGGPELARFTSGFKASASFPVGYWVDPYGFIWWRGAAEITVATPVNNQTIITMPASLRPVIDSHIITAGYLSGTGYTFSFAGARPVSGIDWKGGPTTVGSLVVLDQVTYPLAAVAGWISVSYANSWVDYDVASFTAGRYVKRGDGLVALQGLMKNGTSGSDAFFTPAGSRPGASTSIHAAVANAVFARLDIRPSGGITPAGSNAWFSLDGHFFAPEQ